MRTHLRTLGVVGLAAALMAWVFRSTDPASVWTEIGRARADLIQVEGDFCYVQRIFVGFFWQWVI